MNSKSSHSQHKTFQQQFWYWQPAVHEIFSDIFSRLTQVFMTFSECSRYAKPCDLLQSKLSKLENISRSLKNKINTDLVEDVQEIVFQVYPGIYPILEKGENFYVSNDTIKSMYRIVLKFQLKKTPDPSHSISPLMCIEKLNLFKKNYK